MSFSFAFPHQIATTFSRIFCHLLLISLVFNPIAALAQTPPPLPITPDGSTNTQVTQTASGVDQINIAAPNAGGLSHNKFTDYNVNQSGQVINNFSGKVASEIAAGTGPSAITATQIAGFVTVNPNLQNSGSARVILNEVTSASDTQLLGYTEIAGTNADLILANSNGITCRGCGFINTARLTFIAGSSNFDADGNLGFNLKEQNNPSLSIPLITVEGLGLDVETAKATDIIASSIKLISTIYAKNDADVTLQAGEGRYNTASKAIEPTVGAAPSPALFAIDASNLASIQAGKIFIIATKEGFGVNLDSNLIAQNSLNIDAAGNVYYSNAQSPEINIKSTKSITQKTNTTTSASGNINIEAGETFSAEADSQIQSSDSNLTIASKNLSNYGTLSAKNEINFTLSDSLTNSGVINSNSLNLTANNLTNDAEISGTNLTFNISNLLTNNSLIYAENQLTISAANLTNSNNIYSALNSNITSSNNITNSGAITTENNLTFNANTLTNNYLIQSGADLSIAATNLNNYAVIYSENNSTLTTTNLTNQSSGQIYSQKDLTIATANLANLNTIYGNKVNVTASGDTLNNSASGIIESATTLSLNTTNLATLTNSGILNSSNKLELTSNSGTITNSGALYSEGGQFAFTSSTANFENYGNIAANTNLTITSSLANFINKSSGNINSGDYALNITDSSTHFTNFGRILSDSTLNLSTNNLTNNATIQSSEKLTINSNTLTNASATSLILGSSDIEINSNTINNQNTKSDGATVTSGIVSGNGSVVITADSLNNDSGLIRARGITKNADATFSNSSGIFTEIAAAVILNLATDTTYTITGAITAADYVDITAGSIINLGDVTTTDYIKLNATSGNITNGISGADNSNIKLAAGSYLAATAANSILNYATLSAETNLSLTATSGAISNYNAITGGEGTTTITTSNATNGNFNNETASSKLTAAGNLNLNIAKDLNNNGEISVKNDLSANINNNLNNNQSALIWSGRDTTLNINNNLTNTSATIYSERDLTIQKNSSSDPLTNKTNSVQNISGNIETYNGDIVIKAVTLENKRLVDVVDKRLVTTTVWDDNQILLQSGWIMIDSWCQGNYCGINSRDYFSTVTKNSNSISGKINSGNDLNVVSNNFNNLVSEIYAAKDINISANTFNNYSETDLVGNVVYRARLHDGRLQSYLMNPMDVYNTNEGVSFRFYKPDGYEFGELSGHFNGRSNGGWIFYAKNMPGYYYETFSSNIKSGNNLTITATNQINNGTIAHDSTTSAPEQRLQSTTYNNINLQQLSDTGIINIDLSEILAALAASSSAPTDSDSTSPTSSTINLGSLKITPNSNTNTPLIEARSIFTDKGKFFGSKYFYDAMGLDGDQILDTLNRQTRFLGDAYTESKLIADQLRILRKDSVLLSDASGDDSSVATEVKSLLDNSIAEFKRLNLSISDVTLNGLTAAQVNSLNRDIITFESTNLNGMNIIVPKIYLSLATRNKLLGADASSASLASGAAIYSGGDLTINSPTATLTNSGSIISAKDVTLNLASLNSRSAAPTAIASPIVKSIAGNINITASNGVALSNTLLNSGNKISITARDISVINNPIKLTASSPATSVSAKSGLLFSASAIKDDAETARAAITFNAISDIELTSTGSINIANNYLNTGGSIFMTAANDINNTNHTIKASENVVMNATNINNIHEDSGYSASLGATTAETRIEGGNIVSLNATKDADGNGGNITNIGATIKAGNLLYLTAENNISNEALVNYKINGSATNADGSTITEADALASNARKIRSTLVSQGNLESGGNLVLVAGNDINNKGSNITAAGAAYLEATAGDINITTAALRDRTVTSWGNKKKSGTNTSDTTTNIESNITSNGNLDLASIAGDINIAGSKLNTDGNLTLSAANDVNIAAAQNTSFKESTYQKKGMTVSKSSMSVKQTLTNVKSELDAGGDISITSGADTNLIGVKLNSENAAINAGKELNIFSVADQSYSFASASKSRNYSSIMKFVLPGLGLMAKFFDAVPIPVLSNITQFENSLANGDFSSKSSLNEKNKITNQASGLDVVGNLTLTANNNLNIKGSNLSGGGDASLTSTVGDINIYNVVDVDYSRSESRSSRTTWSSVGAGLIQTGAAAASSSLVAMDTLKTPAQKKHAFEDSNEESKNVPKQTNTNININSNETIIASNLNFTNLNINSNKNTNVTSSNLDASNSASITSGDSTNILTAVENDYSYTFNEKKTPSIAAALSNAVVKGFNELMPSFGHKKSDNTESNDQIEELAYDTDRSKIETTSKTNIASNLTTSLGDISITSNGNNLISGSNLSGGRNINLTSTTGSTTITSAADQKSVSTEDVNQEYNKISGNYNRGRTSVDSESSVVEQTTTTTTTTQKQSTISAANNITITSKKDLNILSSDLTAGTNPSTSDTTTSGTINLTSREGNVNILALADTISTTSETKTGTLTLSAGIGNSHVDTAYAEYDAIQAAKALADAKKNLNHMETLEKNGQASSEAVEDAKINLAIAYLNLTLAELKLAAAAAKSAASANSLWTGFYGDLRLSIAGTKVNSSTNISTAVASNINSNGNLIINSGASLLATNTDLIAGTVGNTTITGSNISSEAGDINIASKNNTTINASKDTYNNSTTSKAWESNITLGSSAGSGIAATLDNAINALQVSLSLSMNKSKSDTASTTYNNSQLTANNGSISITSNGTTASGSQTGGDTTIKGGNILGQDVTITSNGNLSVESLQNSYTEKGKSFGLNFGGGTSNVSGGINYSSNKTDRLWTDNQTSILGTNSVTINTANNTNIKGAIIANITNTDDLNKGNGVIGYNINSTTLADAIDGGNLTLNTKSLTTQNLNDHHITENFGAGFSTSIGTGMNGNSANPMQNLNFYPTGSTTLSLQNASTKKEGTTFATIGNGTLNITDASDTSTLNRDITKSQIVTLDQITGALDASVTIDNRLFVAAYEGLTDQKEKIQNDKTLTKEEKEAKIEALQSSVLWKEQTDLPKNLGIATKAQAKLIDSPLTLAATSDIPYLSYAASYVAGEGGSFATLATQLFGLNYLLDSGNTKWQENKIVGLDNKTLGDAVQNKDEFKLSQSLGDGDSTHRSSSFTITDKEGNTQTFNYTTDFKNLSDVSLADLANTKDYSLHGIDNTSDQGFRNGLMQLGTLQNETENGLSFVTLNAATKGGIPDAVENFYNSIFGKTPLASANIIQLQDFSKDLAGSGAKDVRMVGHSNGGDRLYLGVLRGVEKDAFKYVDASGKESSRLSVQFYGTPSMSSNLAKSAQNAGVGFDKTYLHNINSGDFVGNILGANASSAKEAALSVIKMPLLVSPSFSPHSNYYCEGSFCKFEQINQTGPPK